MLKPKSKVVTQKIVENEESSSSSVDEATDSSLTPSEEYRTGSNEKIYEEGYFGLYSCGQKAYKFYEMRSNQ